MLRLISGVLVGYFSMAALIVLMFFITIWAMGWDGVLQPDSYWTTDIFNMIILVGGFFASIVGGAVCRMIARRRSAALALIAIVVVFGIGGAMMNMSRPEPPARTGVITLEDLNEHGKEPLWFGFGKVVIGALGLMIGSALFASKSAVKQP